MEENNKMEWLEGQTMTIPVEEFINLRLELAKLNEKNDNLYHRIWSTEAELKETQDALAEAKKQIKELLGINEGEEDA